MKKVIIVVIICVVIAGIVFTVTDYVSLQNAISSGRAVAVTLGHPPRGSGGGAYTYDVSLSTKTNGGTLDPKSTITRMVVVCQSNAILESVSSATPGYTAAMSTQSGTRNAFVTGTGASDVNLEYKAGSSSISYADGEMIVTIESPIKVFLFIEQLVSITYKRPVPTPAPEIGGSTPDGQSGND